MAETMRFRYTLLLVSAMALPSRAPAQTPKACPADPRGIIRIAAENDNENDVKARSYTYMQRDEEHKLNSHGEIKSTESKTYDVLFLAGEQTQRGRDQNQRRDHPTHSGALCREAARNSRATEEWGGALAPSHRTVAGATFGRALARSRAADVRQKSNLILIAARSLLFFCCLVVSI